MKLRMFSHLALTPNVILGDNNPSVDYGNMLRIVCETSQFFRVEWRHKDGALGTYVIHVFLCML